VELPRATNTPTNTSNNDLSNESQHSISNETIWGCHEDIFSFLLTIIQLSVSLHVHDSYVRDALIRSPEMLVRAHELEQAIRQWIVCSNLPHGSAERGSLIKSSGIFRRAVLLLFYRLIWDINNDDPRVQDAITNMLEILGE
jgi:hypothetical protein